MTDPHWHAAKLIAIYFPQFHAIAENNAWWGAGFTDWDSVRSAKPQYPGHVQPRVPLGGQYYDQSQVQTLRWQVEELRVSLFAQELRTPAPVSIKRLQKAWEELQ